MEWSRLVTTVHHIKKQLNKYFNTFIFEKFIFHSTSVNLSCTEGALGVYIDPWGLSKNGCI